MKTFKVDNNIGVNNTYTIRETIEPNKLFKLFGAKNKVIKYKGSGTVWYNYNTRQRCSTTKERELSTELYLKHHPL